MALDRLAVYYHMPCYIGEHGTVYANPVMGTFVESLSEHFRSVILLSPEIYTQNATTSYKLDNPEKIRFISLGQSGHYWDYFQKVRRIKQVVEQTRDQWDILLLRAPTPRAYAIWKYSGRPRHTALLLVGNSFSPAYSNYYSLGGLFSLIRFLWFDFGLRRICRKPNNLIMANNRSLVMRWGKHSQSKVELIHTSSISDKDIVKTARPDLCQGETFQLLFVGRVCLDKGIRELFEALHSLNHLGSSAYFLDIVGPIGDLGHYSFNQMLDEYEVADFVRYHGTVSFGNELYALYRKADAYVLPSYHEGMPKTVWEAMSQGTPAIATIVGGMKDFLKDEKDIILVEPKNSKSIAEAVLKLKDYPELASSLSRAGIMKARHITKETQALSIVRLMIERWGF